MISITRQTLVRAVVAGAIVAAPLTALSVSAQAEGVPLTDQNNDASHNDVGQDVARPGRPAPGPRAHVPPPRFDQHRPDFRGPHYPSPGRYLPPLEYVFPGDFGSF